MTKTAATIVIPFFDELKEILESPHPARLVIAAYADFHEGHLMILLSNRKNVSIPFSAFQPTNQIPEFYNLYITDYGQTIVLGKYEASLDVILADNRLTKYD